jgi:hypothetical protein
MNPNYNQTITIYNCFRAADNPDSQKDIWQKTVLHDCFYKCVISRTEYADKEPKMANTYTVRIPESAKYKKYSEWAKLPEEERKQCFTCSQKDIVIMGECGDEITGTSPDTASQLLTRYKPDAFIVTAFSDNTSHRLSKHYRLGG